MSWAIRYTKIADPISDKIMNSNKYSDLLGIYYEAIWAIYRELPQDIQHDILELKELVFDEVV